MENIILERIIWSLIIVLGLNFIPLFDILPNNSFIKLNVGLLGLVFYFGGCVGLFKTIIK